MILPSLKSHFIDNIDSRYAHTFYTLWVLKSEGICGNALGDASNVILISRMMYASLHSVDLLMQQLL